MTQERGHMETRYDWDLSSGPLVAYVLAPRFPVPVETVLLFQSSSDSTGVLTRSLAPFILMFFVLRHPRARRLSLPSCSPDDLPPIFLLRLKDPHVNCARVQV